MDGINRGKRGKIERGREAGLKNGLREGWVKRGREEGRMEKGWLE